MIKAISTVYLFAAFRCACGKICAMADQPNGNAAMIHQWPFCERYDRLAAPDDHQTRDAAQKYFFSLPQIPLTLELAEELTRTCHPPEVNA